MIKKLISFLAASVMVMSVSSVVPAFADTSYSIESVSSAAATTSISSCSFKLSCTSYIYNGTAKLPSVTVKKGSATLKRNTDYTLSYANNKNVGTASVTVKGKGKYTGTKKLTFSIKALNTTTGVKTEALSDSSMKISWSKNSNANGYILQRYDTAKKTYVNVKTTSSTSYTNTGLSAGTSYKYRVCAYRKIGTVTYKTYSSVITKSTLTTEQYYQNEVLRLVNIERKKVGAAELKSNAVLNSLASKRAIQIKSEFSHSYKGSSAGDMLDNMGYTWYAWGENIAAGQRTPQEVVTAWMNSPGHKKNILNTKFKKLGVGYSNKYWVQVFTD